MSDKEMPMHDLPTTLSELDDDELDDADTLFSFKQLAGNQRYESEEARRLYVEAYAELDRGGANEVGMTSQIIHNAMQALGVDLPPLPLEFVPISSKSASMHTVPPRLWADAEKSAAQAKTRLAKLLPIFGAGIAQCVTAKWTKEAPKFQPPVLAAEDGSRLEDVLAGTAFEKFAGDIRALFDGGKSYAVLVPSKFSFEEVYEAAGVDDPDLLRNHVVELDFHAFKIPARATTLSGLSFTTQSVDAAPFEALKRRDMPDVHFKGPTLILEDCLVQFVDTVITKARFEEAGIEDIADLVKTNIRQASKKPAKNPAKKAPTKAPTSEEDRAKAEAELLKAKAAALAWRKAEPERVEAVKAARARLSKLGAFKLDIPTDSQFVATFAVEVDKKLAISFDAAAGGLSAFLKECNTQTARSAKGKKVYYAVCLQREPWQPDFGIVLRDALMEKLANDSFAALLPMLGPFKSETEKMEDGSEHQVPFDPEAAAIFYSVDVDELLGEMFRGTPFDTKKALGRVTGRDAHLESLREDNGLVDQGVLEESESEDGLDEMEDEVGTIPASGPVADGSVGFVDLVTYKRVSTFISAHKEDATRAMYAQVLGRYDLSTHPGEIERRLSNLRTEKDQFEYPTGALRQLQLDEATDLNEVSEAKAAWAVNNLAQSGSSRLPPAYNIVKADWDTAVRRAEIAIAERQKRINEIQAFITHLPKDQQAQVAQLNKEIHALVALNPGFAASGGRATAQSSASGVGSRRRVTPIPVSSGSGAAPSTEMMAGLKKEAASFQESPLSVWYHWTADGIRTDGGILRMCKAKYEATNRLWAIRERPEEYAQDIAQKLLKINEAEVLVRDADDEFATSLARMIVVYTDIKGKVTPANFPGHLAKLTSVAARADFVEVKSGDFEGAVGRLMGAYPEQTGGFMAAISLCGFPFGLIVPEKDLKYAAAGIGEKTYSDIVFGSPVLLNAFFETCGDQRFAIWNPAESRDWSSALLPKDTPGLPGTAYLDPTTNLSLATALAQFWTTIPDVTRKPGMILVQSAENLIQRTPIYSKTGDTPTISMFNAGGQLCVVGFKTADGGVPGWFYDQTRFAKPGESVKQAVKRRLPPGGGGPAKEQALEYK